ncbi:hypothetical protein [Pseudomonas sp. 2FE]|nr:hypothetical protein [Pseudomonas sp. 2FE]
MLDGLGFLVVLADGRFGVGLLDLGFGDVLAERLAGIAQADK